MGLRALGLVCVDCNTTLILPDLDQHKGLSHGLYKEGLRCGWCEVNLLSWVDICEFWEPIDEWDYYYIHVHDFSSLLNVEQEMEKAA